MTVKLPSKSINDIPFFLIMLPSFAILLLLGLQGFDVVDEGWYLSFYQQFFNHPETVEYNFVFYLTGLIGGLWYELFPEGGIYSFRILAVLVITACAGLSFKILESQISKPAILVGLIMVIFVEDFGYLSFYYNHLSAFIALSTIYFLMKGTLGNKNRFLMFAGVLTSVNIFVRLPNITLIALILCIPVCHGYPKQKDEWKQLIRHLTAYGVGLVIGVVLSYATILSLGHDTIFDSAIKGVISKGQNEGSNHNLIALFKVYLGNYFIVFTKLVKLLFVFSLALFFRPFVSNKVIRFFWIVIVVLGFLYVFIDKIIYAVYALNILAGTVYFFSREKKDKSFETLIFLAFAVMVLMPLGSDGGVNNVGYMAIWLMLPISIHVLVGVQFSHNAIGNSRLFQLLNSHKNKVTILLILSFAATRIYRISHNAYFDPGSRLEKVEKIQSPLANGIYTTKERADISNNILQALKLFVKKDDYLLAYDKIPMLNYLTETKPYMYNSWVWVYDGVMFEQQLTRAQNEIDVLPVIVQQKFETIDAFSEPISDYLSEKKNENYYYNRQRVAAINRFIQENGYEIVWSNEYFNIYTANNTTNKK